MVRSRLPPSPRARPTDGRKPRSQLGSPLRRSSGARPAKTGPLTPTLACVSRRRSSYASLSSCFRQTRPPNLLFLPLHRSPRPAHRGARLLQQLARKQLNFSKMTQRDKQQLVAEVYVLSLAPGRWSSARRLCRRSRRPANEQGGVLNRQHGIRLTRSRRFLSAATSSRGCNTPTSSASLSGSVSALASTTTRLHRGPALTKLSRPSRRSSTRTAASSTSSWSTAAGATSRT
jgi:hypothetical protein